MRAKLLSSFVVLVLLSLTAFAVDGKVSYKYLRKQLKKDSSEATNKRLTDEVLSKGVKFVYNQKRDAELRKLGASDMLIRAIYSSVIDENEEENLYDKFKDDYDDKKKEVRKKAYDVGVIYLRRFEGKERFANNYARVKRDMEDLICEFDPDSGC